jgi:hypothetical protein
MFDDNAKNEMKALFGFILDAEDVEGIRDIVRTAQGYIEPCCDDEDCECHFNAVRLQIHEGTWAVHTGDASYDQDHRGFWGASSVEAHCDEETLDEIVMDLIDQALESAAQAA